MKRAMWQLGITAALAALTLLPGASSVRAAEDRRGEPMDRIERLERRLNEMAQRQEQFMRQMGTQQERQAREAAPLREKMRERMAQSRPEGLGAAPMPPGAPAPGLATIPAQPHPVAAKACKDIAGLIGLCLMVAFIFNILIAIWIFTDIRKRGEGSGIFIALALLAGIPAAIIYTLVRIGDRKA
jgi:hypothetical protein